MLIPLDHRPSRCTAAFVLALAILILASAPVAAAAQEDRPAMTAESWRQDLALMTGLLERLHANPFHSTSRHAWEAEVQQLEAAIPDLEDHEIMVAMTRLVASIGDGHTRLNLRPGAPGVPSDPEAGFVRLPLRLQWFADGLFVRSASSDLRRLVGNRVVEIGRLPVEEAIERVLPVLHHDNDMTKRLLLPEYATMPAVLRATGVVEVAGPVRIVVETTDTHRIEHYLEASAGADAGIVDAATPAGIEVPWWLQTRGRPYWVEVVPGSRALYVQLNASRPHGDEPMADFVERLRMLLDGGRIERVVLDLRKNDGGDSRLTRPLLALLADWEGASPDHGLFVLIGRATFSAAVVLATELERFTGAVLVGEPTGGRPNQYGEIEMFELPHSGLTVSYASWYFQTSDPWDARPWVAPDLTVDLAFDDFAAGRDPALEMALSHDFEVPSLTEVLIRAGREGGFEAALEEYRQFRAEPKHRYADTERALTELVVDFWRRDEVPASLPVALLVAEEYPGSFEAHENVAEIHADQGNAGEAVRHAVESLRLLPTNGDALSVLVAVCGPAISGAFLASDPATKEGREALVRACGHAIGP